MKRCRRRKIDLKGTFEVNFKMSGLSGLGVLDFPVIVF